MTDRQMWIKGASLASLGVAGLLFWAIFVGFSDLQGWVLKDLEVVPFIIWMLVGGVIGAVLHLSTKTWSLKLNKLMRNGIAGLLAWLVIAVVISSLTGEGSLAERMRDGPLLRGWEVLMWALLSLSPAMLGVHGVLARSRFTMGLSVVSFFVIASFCMIFPQARSSTISSQNFLLSIGFIWSIVIFIESGSWLRRYSDGDVNMGALIGRRVRFTLIFLGVGSVFACVPFLMDGGTIGLYEGDLISGKLLIAIAILFPLVLIAFMIRYLDAFRTRKEGQ